MEAWTDNVKNINSQLSGSGVEFILKILVRGTIDCNSLASLPVSGCISASHPVFPGLCFNKWIKTIVHYLRPRNCNLGLHFAELLY